MKRILITAPICLLAIGVAQAQTKIKDGTVAATATAPNANAVLDIESNNKGLLLPRVALTSIDAATPLAAFVAGMHVYNTATAGISPNNVTPGEYYSDGTVWIKVGTAATEPWNNQATGTGATSNTQNIYQMGKVGIGISSLPGAMLEVNSGVAGTSGLKFTNLNASPASSAFLGLNATGDVIVVDGAAARQYLAAARTGSDQLVTGPADIVLNSVQATSSTIPFNAATGVATLTVGKTYLITASLHVFPFDNSAYMTYTIANASTNLPVNFAASAEVTNGASVNPAASSGTITTIYKPIAGGENIKLRVAGLQNAGSGGTAYIRSDLFSGFTITEL